MSRRFTVISIQDTTYIVNGTYRLQKTLQLQEDKTDTPATVHLREDWLTTTVIANDTINIIGTFTNNTCVIDNPHGLLILHPDNLVSSTHVADSFKCIRRAVLQDQIKATSETSKPLVYGSMIHELFQTAISKVDFS